MSLRVTVAVMWCATGIHDRMWWLDPWQFKPHTHTHAHTHTYALTHSPTQVREELLTLLCEDLGTSVVRLWWTPEDGVPPGQWYLHHLAQSLVPPDTRIMPPLHPHRHSSC
jgi:hypothetical protein